MGFFDFLKPKFLTVRRISSSDQTQIRQQWASILELIKLGKPSTLKEAVVKADKILDFALRSLVEGETLGERLKNSKDKFTRTGYDNIWKAHKVRNAMAHELNYDPPTFVLKEALESFGQGLKELGVYL